MAVSAASAAPQLEAPVGTDGDQLYDNLQERCSSALHSWREYLGWANSKHEQS